MPAFIAIGQAAIGRADAGVAALVVEFGEAGLTALDHQPVDTVVGQADAAKGLRQHAGFATGDHRVGKEQVAGLQFGIEGPHFQGAASRGKRARCLAVAIADRQDARPVGATTAVELEPEHRVGINAETDGALAEARFEAAEKALTPLDVVIGLLQAIAVHVVVAGIEVEARPIDKAFAAGFVVGLRVVGHRCSDCNEQRTESERETHVR